MEGAFKMSEMNDTLYVRYLLLLSLLIFGHIQAQEEIEIKPEESAEVFLEAYSDDFQEKFFEGLKQKGIENYDRAINLFLQCKRLDSENKVVDHELAKVYFEAKQYPLAEAYAITALNSELGNLWYLDTLVQILKIQGRTIADVDSSVDMGNPKLNENLASVYYNNMDYEGALKVLQQAKKSRFTEDLILKINDSLEKLRPEDDAVSFPKEGTVTDPSELEQYNTRINSLMASDNFEALEQLSSEALERYPSHPYFYYANGHALHKTGKINEAIEMLETALDYLLNDDSLANMIYRELSEAYAAVGNTVKSNMYLRMIKRGF